MFQKSMRELFSIKSVHTLNNTFLVSLLVFAKILTRNIAIFMDLYKAFDTLNLDLLIAKF